jgi:L-amino acid N-acyltransferase YncA
MNSNFPQSFDDQLKNVENKVIRNARIDDIDQIIEICNQQNIKNKNINNQKNIGKSGFLITKKTKEQLHHLISNQDFYLALVYERNNHLIGYLIGFDLIEHNSADFQNQILSYSQHKKQPRKIFYYDQIAKSLDSKNVGSSLVLAMIEHLKNKGYKEIFCQIFHQPFNNQASIKFHEKLGFKLICEITEDIDQINFTKGLYHLAID